MCIKVNIKKMKCHFSAEPQNVLQGYVSVSKAATIHNRARAISAMYEVYTPQFLSLHHLRLNFHTQIDQQNHHQNLEPVQQMLTERLHHKDQLNYIMSNS